MKKTSIIVLNILFILLAIVSVFAAMMSPFLFDAPGSEHNTFVIIAFGAMLILPISCFSSVVASLYFLFRKHNFSKAGWVFTIPFIIMLIIIGCFIGIDIYCNGLFSCPKQ